MCVFGIPHGAIFTKEILASTITWAFFPRKFNVYSFVNANPRRSEVQSVRESDTLLTLVLCFVYLFAIFSTIVAVVEISNIK